MAKKNEVVKRGAEEIAKFDPELAAMMNESSAQSLDNMRQEDISQPRLLLLQGLSKIVSDGDGRSGQMAHSTTGELYTAKPGEAITIVPVFYWYSRILMKPIDDGGGILCRSEDGKVGRGDPGGDCSKCPKSRWTETAEKRVPPPCDAVHNLIVHLPDIENESIQQAVLSFRRTNYGIGTQLLNKLRGLRGRPWFHQFRLGARKTTAGKNEFWVFDLQKFEDSNRYDKPVADREDWKVLLPGLRDLEELFRGNYEAGKIEAHYDHDDDASRSPSAAEVDDDDDHEWMDVEAPAVEQEPADDDELNLEEVG